MWSFGTHPCWFPRSLLDAERRFSHRRSFLFRRGGAIHDVSPNATAFPYRSAVYNVGLLLVVPSDEPDREDVFQREAARVNQWWPNVQKYLTGSYLNYPTLSLGNDYAKAFWGDNLPRLMELKREFDPGNVFAYPMGVPLVD